MGQRQVRLSQFEQRPAQPYLRFLEIRIVRQRDFKKLARFVELPRLAMNFSQLISRVGIGGIELKLLLEFLRCLCLRIGLPRTRQKRSAQAEMDTRAARIQREHLPVFSDCKVVVSLTFVSFPCRLMRPDRTWRHL